jgi:hypothetical protein
MNSDIGVYAPRKMASPRHNRFDVTVLDTHDVHPREDGNSSIRLAATDVRSGHRPSGEYTDQATSAERIPAHFIENKGQVDGRVKAYLNNGAQAIWLTQNRVIFDLLRYRDQHSEEISGAWRVPSSHQSSRARAGAFERLVFAQDFVGAKTDPRVEMRSPQPGTYNFLLGNDASRWRTGVRGYRSAIYRDVWPNVDVRFISNGRYLEQEFILRPGGDHRQIQVAYHGVEELRVKADGSLGIVTAFGELRESAPRIYQDIEGNRIEVSGCFRLLGKTAYTFEIAAYDPHHDLVIDPTLVYSSYLGGKGISEGLGVTIDDTGHVLVTGFTASPDFPTSANALQPESGSLLNIVTGIVTGSDAFVTKLAPSGTTLIYSTYLGGSGDDQGHGIAVDASGNVLLTGATNSTDFPTVNALQSSFGGEGARQKGDAFVAKLDSTGTTLLYSTYLGGSEDDEGNAIAVDGKGNSYVTGYTNSDDFPTANAFQPDFRGGSTRGDAFVAKLNPDGTVLEYSTFLGGSRNDGGNGIAVDDAGNAYVTGFSASEDFPTVNPLQPTSRGAAFVAKLNPSGSALLYATHLGGSGVDEGLGIAVDGLGHAYVTGVTESDDFPTVNPVQATFGGGSGLVTISDGFAAKLNPSGSALVFSTYLGGSGNDRGNGIAVDSAGNSYVIGTTNSADFPLANPLQSNLGGDPSLLTQRTDAFLVKLGPSGSTLNLATYLGGDDNDKGNAIAVDSLGNVVIAGDTRSDTFPVLNGAQVDFRGIAHAFVARIATEDLPAGLGVQRIFPDKAGDTGPASLIIKGSAFAQGATVRLRRGGQADIAGDPVSVAADGAAIMATFDLSGEALGAWDVEVTNPDGSAVTLPGGFVVEQGREPIVWLDIVGRNRIRAGRAETYSFLFGNQGSVDARGVPIWIAGFPADAEVRLDFNITPLEVQPGDIPADTSQVSPIIDTGSGKLIALFVPVIPGGMNGTIKVTVTVPTIQTFTLESWANPPLFRSPPDPKAIKCYSIVIQTALSDVLGVFIGSDCILSLDTVLANRIDAISTHTTNATFSTFLDPNNDLSLSSLANILVDLAKNIVKDCAPNAVQFFLGPRTVAVLATKGVQLLFELPGVIKECSDPDPEPEPDGGGDGTNSRWSRSPKKDVRSVQAVDPNDKIGSDGTEAQRYVSGEEPLRYTIFFENLETAGAAAQEVVISDELDFVNLALETVSLGPITFGDVRLNPLPGARAFVTEVDLRPRMDLVVRIEAALDAVSGVLTWRFSSLDPLTGGVPADPLAGFLPPNVAEQEGEGSVSFTVSPEPGLPTGTEIRNQAAIVFDQNPPIVTGEWLNTLDVDHPISRVLPLAKVQRQAKFEVAWEGKDEGAGITDYTIYVAEDGGAFKAWLVNTTATSGAFSGEEGRTYTFFSIARDGGGNREPLKSQAEAMTQVSVEISKG